MIGRKQILLLLFYVFFFTNCKKESIVQILDQTYRTSHTFGFNQSRFVVTDDYLALSFQYELPNNSMDGLALFKFKEGKFEPISMMLDWELVKFNNVLSIYDNMIVTQETGLDFSTISLYSLPLTNSVRNYEAEKLYISNDKLFLSKDDIVVAYGMENNDTLWTRQKVSLITHGSNGLVFAANDSALTAFDEVSGSSMWSTRLKDGVDKISCHQAIGDKILISSTKGFSLFDISNGQIIWSVSDYTIESKSIETENYYILSVQSLDSSGKKIGAFNKLSGQIEWLSEEIVRSATVPYLHNGTVIVADQYGNNLLLFDNRSGSLIKKIPFETSGYTFYKDKYMVYGSPEGGVYQIKLRDLLNQ